MPEKLDIAQAYGRTLVELGKENPNVVVVDADIPDSCSTEDFHKHFPGRAFDVGIAEATAVSLGAGLALAGKIPFVNTFACFITSRTLDQIRVSVAYSRANVKLVGAASGLALGYAGPSHHSIEDIALIRSLPNMLILSPADTVETAKMVRAAAEYEGPVYIRLSRQSSPPIYAGDYRFEIGRAVILRQGSDVTLVATGDMVTRALEAANSLTEDGIRAEVVNVHTIKPIDAETIARSARKTGGVVTIEDHSIIGGLGSAVAEVLAECAPVPMRRVGIQDTFTSSDETEVLRTAYHLTASDIVNAAKELRKWRNHESYLNRLCS